MAGESPCIAYIDGANLHRGIHSLNWEMDYARFRSWIRQKYNISVANIFIGRMSTQENLYSYLKNAGYSLIFKDVIVDSSGKVKGNCDADLVLQAVRDYFEQDIREVILVSSDGDYAPLIKFWQEKRVSCVILSPARIHNCSWLLRKTNAPIVCLDNVKNKLIRR